MLDEVLALAASGGAAVVAAAGTDVWQELRQTVAGWFGRGDAGRERRELERLDRTADVLRASGPDVAEQTRIRQEGVWQERFTTALENLDEADRRRAVEQLRALLSAAAQLSASSAGAGGMAVGRDAHFRATDGGLTVGVVNGGVNMNTPSKPDPAQG
ncbi:hypothetical protein [Streptomyces olivochromogenes]|uniref:hypothetical protein n=1 Tax=Streptomyces olivochromogenes TaxID=1963 RepID=UPI0036A9862A